MTSVHFHLLGRLFAGFWVLALSLPAGALPFDGAAARDSIASLLEKEMPNEAELLAEGSAEGRWALRDRLLDDFAHTPVPRRRVHRVMARRAKTRALQEMGDPAWIEALEDRALAIRLRGLPRHQADRAQPLAFDIPLADHPLVDAYVEYFTGRGRWFFRKWLARADRYVPIMRPILEAKGLPADLVYVAMIESGFSARATSTAQAAGFWQFIRSTGRLYGLQQDAWVDERRDFVRATEGAAAYLKKLYGDFDDWHLAWAAYNAGEGRIRRALEKTRVKDYWTLTAKPHALAKETVHYVPKIIAAAIISKDRLAYGFDDVNSLPPLEYDELQIRDASDLRMIAKRLQVGLSTLRALNPGLTVDITPPGQVWTLRVPQGRGAEAATWLANLPRSKRLRYAQHRVRKGDTLYGIAHRYGTTMSVVKSFNSIGNPRGLRPGQRLIIPTPTPPPNKDAHRRPERARRVAKAGPRPVPAIGAKPVARHTVAAGETLWAISQRYGVSVSKLKRWNTRVGNTLGVGEVLDIFAAGN